MTRKDQSRREQFAKVILDNALKYPNEFFPENLHDRSVGTHAWFDALFEGVLTATDKFMDHLGNRVPDKEDAASPFNAAVFHNRPHQRVEGTIDPKAPMPCNLEGIEGCGPYQVHGADVPVVDVLHDTIRELKEERNVLNAQIATLHQKITKEGDVIQGLEKDAEIQNNEVLRLRREVGDLNANLSAAQTVKARYHQTLDACRIVLTETQVFFNTPGHSLEKTNEFQSMIWRVRAKVNEALYGT